MKEKTLRNFLDKAEEFVLKKGRKEKRIVIKEIYLDKISRYHAKDYEFVHHDFSAGQEGSSRFYIKMGKIKIIEKENGKVTKNYLSPTTMKDIERIIYRK